MKLDRTLLEQVRLDADQTTVVFRIVQEALHNVARHARATSCTLRLALSEETVTLHVWDDGDRGGSGGVRGQSGKMGL